MDEINSNFSLIDANYYIKLLEKLNEDLTKDPHNIKILEKKAGILAIIGKYMESYEIFSNLINIMSLHNRENIYSIIILLKNLIYFENEYEQSKKKLKLIPSDWAKKNLLDTIKNTKIKGDRYNFLKVLKSSAKLNDDVFILGPEEIVNNFTSVDSGILRRFIGIMNFPFAQATKEGFSYYKEQNYFLKFSVNTSFEYTFNYEPSFIARFPTVNWKCGYLYEKPNPNCDVFYSTQAINKPLSNMLQYSLDNIAKNTKDYFRPKYHNIIDPNLTAIKQNLKIRNQDKIEDSTAYLWIATDFIIEEYKISNTAIINALQYSIKIVCKGKKFNKLIIYNINKFLKPIVTIGKASIASPIPNFDPRKNKELYVAIESIMTAALPLLSKLRRPALILPGKLQVVIKAQRIYLKPGEEYTGIWHRDGKNEDIVAAVIYYYRTSPGLKGGDLEFVDKKPIIDELWLYGDCDAEDFTKLDVEKYIKESRCRVPVKKGTLVVFSNYQHLHRVLHMANTNCIEGDPKSPDGYASRDFIVLFIVDQKSELLNSSKVNLYETIENYNLREKLFEEQIAPAGFFGPFNDLVCSTGNGCLTQVGWNREITNSDNDDYLYETNGENLNRDGFKIVNKFNINPPMSRGLSWALEIDNDEEKYLI